MFFAYTSPPSSASSDHVVSPSCLPFACIGTSRIWKRADAFSLSSALSFSFHSCASLFGAVSWFACSFSARRMERIFRAVRFFVAFSSFIFHRDEWKRNTNVYASGCCRWNERNIILVGYFTVRRCAAMMKWTVLLTDRSCFFPPSVFSVPMELSWFAFLSQQSPSHFICDIHFVI